MQGSKKLIQYHMIIFWITIQQVSTAAFVRNNTFSVCVLCHTFYSKFKGLVSYDAIISDKIYL